MKILRLVLASCFIFVCSDLAAQIAITPNITPAYGIQTLAGATRQINVQISNTSGGTTATPCGPNTTPSCTGTVNWSVTNIVGGETVTFTDPTHTAAPSITGALPTIQVNVGSVAGNCQASGSTYPYTLTSPVSFNVVATSTDDPTKTATFPFLVCANAPSTNFANGTNPVILLPIYDQIYQGQADTITADVSGCTDESGIWSLTQAPGGNGTLSDTTLRDVVFSATVPGTYKLTYTSTCTTGSNTATLVVTPNALPSYPSTPNQTMPHECYADPSFTADYEVGPGFQYPTIQSAPNWYTWPAGTIMRIHNTDTTGSNPTTYHEWMQVQSTAGTATKPIIICGVPDSMGNLPVIDGVDATSQLDSAPPPPALGGSGLIILFPQSTPYGEWQLGSPGPNYVSIWSLHLAHGKNTYNFYPVPASQTFTITSLQVGGGNVTFNGSGAALKYGEPVIISGLSSSFGSHFNGTITATGGTTTSFTVNYGFQNYVASVTSNVLTMQGGGTAFPAGTQLTLSGFSVAPLTWLNGLVITPSTSTTSTIVATLPTSHADVAASTDYGGHANPSGQIITDSGSVTPTEETYAEGSSCVHVETGYYVDIAGNDMDTCGNGVATFENAAHLWAGISQNVSIRGNHIHGSGVVGDFLEHQAYLQSFYLLFEKNLVDHYTSGALGGNVKWRGVEGIFRYNDIQSGPTRVFDMLDNQDAAPYQNVFSYLQTSNNQGPWIQGDQAGPNVIAGYFESAQNDYVYGNMLWGAGAGGQIHYFEDHDGGVSARNGTLHFYNNTLDTAQKVFDTGDNGSGWDPYFFPRIDARNNIFWSYLTHMAMDTAETIILSATTNLFNNNGSMSIVTPITTGNYNSGTSQGWQNGCDVSSSVPYCYWPLSNPINTHLYGLSSANYLLTSTLPYNPTTMVPVVGSAAVSAGTALTGLPALLPVRYQYQVNTSSVAPRQNALTIGAVDSGPPPTLQSVVLSPLATTLQTGQTQQYLATCNYSDASTTNCTATVTWSSSQPGIASITTNGLASGIASGQTTIMAVSSAISGSTTLTVFVLPTSQWQGMSFKGVTIH